jgi:hypothetical protein
MGETWYKEEAVVYTVIGKAQYTNERLHKATSMTHSTQASVRLSMQVKQSNEVS